MPVLLALLIGLIAFLLISRSREMFVLRVRAGRITVVRGSVPGGLLSQFRDALEPRHNGTIKASRTPTGARLSTRGLDDRAEQRLRNILGLFPASKLSARAIDKREAAHGLLTLAWLLDLLRRR